MNILEEGKKVFSIEIDALRLTRDILSNEFVEIVEIIKSCTGKIVLTGMGKSGHIARKIAATFSSLGTHSFYLHPAEAMHGDLGMISANDVVLILSYSGESDEIIGIISAIKIIGATVIALTGNKDSKLAKTAEAVQVLPKFEEACYIGCAPTSSSTVELCYGDALAVVLSKIYGFDVDDFAKLHPAGTLGKRLILKVDDIMVSGENIPKVERGTFLVSAIQVMSKRKLGAVFIVDCDSKLLGIITDGDLRRIIEKKTDLYNSKVEDVMTKEAKKVSDGVLAINALKKMKEFDINCFPVVEKNNTLVGAVSLQMIVRSGIL